MRNRHLVIDDRLMAILLLEHLALQLELLDMVCHVVEVNCGSLLLQELDAFDSDLSKLILLFYFF